MACSRLKYQCLFPIFKDKIDRYLVKVHEASWTNSALGKRETESLNNIYRGAVITVFLFKTLSLVQKRLLADHI